MTSRRRRIVFTANSARTARVAKRSFASEIVVHVNAAKTPYAASASTKRFTRIRSRPPHGLNWCTGEDSNLRSSLERQIYSLLPLTTRPPVQKPAHPPHAQTETPQCRTAIATRKTKCGNSRLNLRPPENCLMECVRTLALSARVSAQTARCFRKTVSWSWRRDLNP